MPGIFGFKLKKNKSSEDTQKLIDRMSSSLKHHDSYSGKTFSTKNIGIGIIEIHGMTIHPGHHELTIGKKKIPLTYSEFTILHILAKKPGWVQSRYQIVDQLHDKNYVVTDRSIDVFINGLRKKLGSHGSFIETVRGVGYRMKKVGDE